MQSMSVHLPDPLVDRVVARAQEQGISLDELVEQALDTFLQVQQHSNESFQSKAMKYAGCLEGPADLSSNPAYLEGFGE